MTKQEAALVQARKKYGMTAFTEDHIYYRHVGFVSGTKTVNGMGDTWQEAFDNLATKVKQ